MAQTSLVENAQFVISTGDNFYETGVSSLTDEHWSLSFENVYKGNLLQIYSAGFGHGDQPELITTLKPLLEKYGVNLYLCGHSHSSQFIKNANSTINYIVAGAGSSTDELIKQDYPALFGTASPSFTLIRVLNDKIQVSFIDKTGNVLFSKVID